MYTSYQSKQECQISQILPKLAAVWAAVAAVHVNNVVRTWILLTSPGYDQVIGRA